MNTLRDAVLIIAGGLLQVPAVEIAGKMGLVTVVTDINPDAPAMKLADEPVVIDIYDVPAHITLAGELSRRYNLKGILAEGADVEVTTASVAAHLGLPGIPVEAARRCKNKVLMRKTFAENGIPNPRWAEVSDESSLYREVERIGYPLVVKAVDNCASRGITKIYEASDDNILAAYNRAKENSTTGTVLLEECFSGPEQSLEVLFDENHGCHYLNISDRLFLKGEWAIESGHINPSGFSSSKQGEFFKLAEKAAGAVGVNFGPFKMDTIWTEEGPRILEVTARLSGGFHCQYTTPLATGENHIKAALDLVIGNKLDIEDIRPRWHKHAIALSAFPPIGKVTQINGIEDALKVNGVKHIFLRVKVGDVIESYHDCADRPAFAIAVGDSREEAVRNAENGLAALKIETVAV